MANPVTVADLEARWRPLTPVEASVAASLLADAWAIMLARVPDVEARLSSTLSGDLVVAVESAMVLRVLRNPDGKRQETIDDYSWTRDNAVSAGLLYLSDEELALLGPSGAASNAFSIRPYGAPDGGVQDDARLWVSTTQRAPFA